MTMLVQSFIAVTSPQVPLAHPPPVEGPGPGGHRESVPFQVPLVPSQGAEDGREHAVSCERRFADAALLAVLVVVLGAAACGGRQEPSDADLKLLFTQQRATFDELRVRFAEDVRRHRLIRVDVEHPRDSMCEDNRIGSDCLADGRWREYTTAMALLGVQRLFRHPAYSTGPAGIYFHVFYGGRALLTDISRERGVVYVGDASPHTLKYNDDSEERIELGDGWYAFLILES